MVGRSRFRVCTHRAPQTHPLAESSDTPGAGDGGGADLGTGGVCCRATRALSFEKEVTSRPKSELLCQTTQGPTGQRRDLAPHPQITENPKKRF